MADQDNSITRFLSGCENLNTDPIKYRMSDQDLHMAIGNLNNISFIGTVDNFDSSIKGLADHLGWGKIPEYGRDNAFPYHRHKRDLHSREMDLILSSQSLDYTLYDKLYKAGQ